MTTYDDALFEAAKNGTMADFEDLLKGCEDPNMRNSKGDTLLHVVVRRLSVKRVKLLLEAGVSPNPSNQQPKTPLQIAKGKPASRIVDILQKAIKKGPKTVPPVQAEDVNTLKKGSGKSRAEKRREEAR